MIRECSNFFPWNVKWLVFLVNRDFISSRKPWFFKIIIREMKKKYLTRRELCFWLCLLWLSTVIDLSHIPTNNGAESRSGWTKIEKMYENVYPNLSLHVQLFECTEAECWKGDRGKTVPPCSWSSGTSVGFDDWSIIWVVYFNLLLFHILYIKLTTKNLIGREHSINSQ